jgi:two-component system sensor histidine kinase AdeS
MKLVGLSRQIMLAMMAIALGVTLLVILMSYAFYYLWSVYWPDNPLDYSWIPTGPEWIWVIGSTLAGLALSILVAVNLSRRILVPLNSVADSIRRVAQGDLNARAVAGDRSLGEAAQLADDFNAMANQLQRMTEEQAFWNAAIAHELRTPVTILRGRLQGLAEGVFTPSTSQFLSLLTQVEGLTRLIEDLRVVSLVESGHLDLQWQEAQLDAAIRAVVDMVGDALQAAGQRAFLDLDAGSVCCDPVRIRQALLALLDNVCRYAVAGPVRIQSRIKDGWCELSVEDEGPGLPDDLLPYVFTAFRRAQGARSGGSGLGLAVVAAIGRAHGGHAACRTAASGGTVFTLTWPIDPGHGLPRAGRGEHG